MVARTVKQMKVFSITSHADRYCDESGIVEKIPGITWVKESPWESEEECAKMLEKMTYKWLTYWVASGGETTGRKPELNVYWKTIEITEEREK